jgi:rare lipoprotein A
VRPGPIGLALALLCAVNIVFPITTAAKAEPFQRGAASWYGPGFHGRRTASGERFNPRGFTAAHRRLPFGTKVRVTNRRNNRSVVVRINDRGPFTRGRIIDLSAASARAIGIRGVAPVTLSKVKQALNER